MTGRKSKKSRFDSEDIRDNHGSSEKSLNRSGLSEKASVSGKSGNSSKIKTHPDKSGDDRGKVLEPDREILESIDRIMNENPQSRIAILLSGHSPFMGQTGDIDGAFLHMVRRKFSISTDQARILFSPASFFPSDQANYARGFAEYYGAVLGVKVLIYRFDSFFYLEKIGTLISLIAYLYGHDSGGNLSRFVMDRIARVCMTDSMGASEVLSRAGDDEAGLALLRSMAHTWGNERREGETVPKRGSGGCRPDFPREIFIPLHDHGMAALDRVLETLESYRRRFQIRARREMARNRKLFETCHGIYGGGGFTEWLARGYDMKVEGECNWDNLMAAWMRGVPLIGYSAHAILFSAHDHMIFPYDEHNRNRNFLQSLEEQYPRVIPRKRDYFAIRPMKGLVPLSIIVHYERQVEELRKFELNYFDESVPEDVMSLRNNCAVACFSTGGDETRILGIWSRISPPYGDRTSEIRYISYETGKPCKLVHGEARTIYPNPAMPGWQGMGGSMRGSCPGE
ncbi:MAG: hypothetical protein CVV64_10915 [Candidatus Wallbacteria bacterium HGW-Wallbacteria-1]|jgi:hypothetical protein|uniref:Uncharacterized protein n=1 Tax=Candidatus Wallbacteria bacterium HGW-Wallbacteria-1 TaxID=2013854 RepID=A0A2N1PPG9_9BACT|nr:MAG: hypothetical protein CVV64_10915 [Candidatus Wallbacteria bacterium HGW-Wallbacteria-1]